MYFTYNPVQVVIVTTFLDLWDVVDTEGQGDIKP
jgi:hypothetical protein